MLLGRLDYHDGQQLLFYFGAEQDLHDSKKQIASLQQGIFALPNREDYLADDERSRSTRREYVDHLERIFQLLGDSPIRASVEAKNVVAIEIALAKSEVAESELFDPAKRDHLMSVSQLQKLTPSFSWLTYLKTIRQPHLTSLNVENPKFLTGLQELIDSSTIDALRSYIRWSLVHRYASSMSDPFHQENFAFFSSTLEGQAKEKPLWRQCTAAVDGALGEAIGQDWVAENFPPSSKRSTEQMVDALREALRQQINSLDWMSPTTKAEAQAKLTHLRVRVGYPDHWRDYSSVMIVRDNSVANGIAVNAYNRRHDLAKIGHEVDLDEWFVTPPTVTAYTTFAENQSVFPAGILQPPFFRADADPAVNFGAMGSIIGHEMTHGFDTVGSKYDAQGNIRNWWTADDRAHFDASAACIRDEYSGFTILPGVQQDGRRTLGENIADNGGLLIAYKALLSTLAQRKDADTTIDGFSPAQRFFIGFAQFHCQNQTDQNIRSLAKSDPHSADEWRVNGTVQNMPEFSTAFGCKVGQPLAPANVCRVW